MRVDTPVDKRSLESYLADENNNQLAILNLKDQQVLSYAQTRILFKGVLGARFELSLNGDLLSDDSANKAQVLMVLSQNENSVPVFVHPKIQGYAF